MVCMTTDSGANVVSALRINNWQRLPCFGHRLHIAIGKHFLCFFKLKSSKKYLVGMFKNTKKNNISKACIEQ